MEKTDFLHAAGASAAEAHITEFEYAGFWRRTFALSVDFAILVMLFALVVVPLEAAFLFGKIVIWPIPVVEEAAVMGGIKLQILGWLYFALMESSTWQATVGKRLFGLRVTTVEGKPLSFARATGRHFAKYISAAIWMLGFIMAAFTRRKQALHDIMAGTLVLRRGSA